MSNIQFIQDDEYFSQKALSASQIKDYDKSAYHFWKRSVFNDEREKEAETDALCFGKLTHCLVLEPEVFDKKFLVMDWGTKTRNTEKYKKAQAEHPDKMLVLPYEYEKSQKMVSALQNHDLANAILAGGHSEVPFMWTDKETGILCKMKADKIKKIAGGRILIVDYKTTSDIDSILKWPQKLGYPLQEAMYRFGIQNRFNIDDSKIDFMFILQSNKEGEEDVICCADTDYDTLIAAEDITRHHIREISEKLKEFEEKKDKNIFSAYPNKMTIRYSNWYLERGE